MNLRMLFVCFTNDKEKKNNKKTLTNKLKKIQNKRAIAIQDFSRNEE